MEILKWLDASPVVHTYQVLDFKALEGGWYYKIKVELKDGSVLHAREYADETERNYAYHGQDAQHQLRVRWDHAPHHKQVTTYPHHKHVGSGVQPSREITMDHVLEYIQDQLQRER